MVASCGRVLRIPAGNREGYSNAIGHPHWEGKCCKCLILCGRAGFGLGERNQDRTLRKLLQQQRLVAMFSRQTPIFHAARLAWSDYTEFCILRVAEGEDENVESLSNLAHFRLRPNLIVLSCAGGSWGNRAGRRSETCQPREERRYFKWHFVASRSDRNRRRFDQFDMIVPGIQPHASSQW